MITEQHTLPLENVISVQHNYLKNTHPSEDKVIDPNRFTIHYAKQDQNIWKYAYLILKHSDHLQVSSWVKTLQNHLQCKQAANITFQSYSSNLLQTLLTDRKKFYFLLILLEAKKMLCKYMKSLESLFLDWLVLKSQSTFRRGRIRFEIMF